MVTAGNMFLLGRSRRELVARGEFASVGEDLRMRFVVETGRLLRYRDFSRYVVFLLSD